MKKFLLSTRRILCKFGIVAVIVALVVCATVFHRQVIVGVSLCVTAVQIAAAFVSSVVQFSTVVKERRINDTTASIIVGWCLVGTLPAIAFGYVQWVYLKPSPWMILLPCTVAFGMIYGFLYWGWLQRRMVFYTEGRDYVLALKGSGVSPLQN